MSFIVGTGAVYTAVRRLVVSSCPRGAATGRGCGLPEAQGLAAGITGAEKRSFPVVWDKRPAKHWL